MSESAYRRGVAQALSLAGDLVRDGATADDIDRLSDLSMDMRYDGLCHGTYIEDLRRLYDSGAHGKTGFIL